MKLIILMMSIDDVFLILILEIDWRKSDCSDARSLQAAYSS